MLLQYFFQWKATTGTVWVRSSWRRSCRSCRRRSKCCSSDTVGTWRNSWDWRTQSASWDKATCWMKSGCSCLRGWRALSTYMKLDKVIYFLWNNQLSQRWWSEGTEHIRVKIQWKCCVFSSSSGLHTDQRSSVGRRRDRGHHLWRGRCCVPVHATEQRRREAVRPDWLRTSRLHRCLRPTVPKEMWLIHLATKCYLIFFLLTKWHLCINM